MSSKRRAVLDGVSPPISQKRTRRQCADDMKKASFSVRRRLSGKLPPFKKDDDPSFAVSPVDGSLLMKSSKVVKLIFPESSGSVCHTEPFYGEWPGGADIYAIHQESPEKLLPLCLPSNLQYFSIWSQKGDVKIFFWIYTGDQKAAIRVGMLAKDQKQIQSMWHLDLGEEAVRECPIARAQGEFGRGMLSIHTGETLLILDISLKDDPTIQVLFQERNVLPSLKEASSYISMQHKMAYIVINADRAQSIPF